MKINALSLITTFMLFAALGSTNSVLADDAMQAALNSDIRSADEKARDESRKPAETLGFFEVKPDSKVLELMPGGGWYTKILGNYLKGSGELYLAIGANAGRLGLEKNMLEHVKIVGENFDLKASAEKGIYSADSGDLGINDLDVALTFRNMHNLDEATRLVLNKAVLNALKPGGIYGVIDHTKRHMEPDTKELWRREDPVQMIKEMVSLGFEFVDYSTVHARPNDKLIYDSTHKSINRDSDRFTLKFRKPG